MNGEVNAVVSALRVFEYPVIRAYPGQIMEIPTQPMAAVSLFKVVPGQVTVQVTMTAPAALGGAACENATIKAGRILQNLGAVSIEGPCKYDDRCDLLSMELFVTFVYPEE